MDTIKDELVKAELQKVMQEAVDLMNSKRADWFEDYKVVAERGRRLLLAGTRADSKAGN